MKLDAPSVSDLSNMQHTHASAAQGGPVSAADIASGATLSKTDDTNVTLTLGGTVASALLKAISLTLGWTGFLATTRGGTGVDNSTGGTANQFWARPNGATGAATYRAIVAADIPTLNQNTTGTAGGLTGTPAITVAAVTATTVTASDTISSTKVGTVFSAVASNSNAYQVVNITNSAAEGYAQFKLLASTGGVQSNFGIYHAPGSFIRLFSAGTTDPIDIGVNDVRIARVSTTGLAVTGAISATSTATLSAYGAGIATFSAAGVISSTATTGTGSVVQQANPTLTNIVVSHPDSYAQIAINGGAAGDASWLVFSGYPSVGDFALRQAGVLNALIIAKNTGHTTPGADNTQNFGSAALRWATIYAGTGAINTSDAREKTAVRGMSDAEIAAAKDLSKEVGIYQFIASISAKGDKARQHVGMTVQRAIEVMKSHGLSPFNYGFICYDKWEDAFFEHPEITPVEGSEGIEAVEGKAAWVEQTQKAGDRYAFRYDQLNLFIARGFEARLSALELK